MSISRVHAETVIDLDHVAVSTTWPCKHYSSRCGRADRCPPRATEIKSGMKPRMVCERINSRPKIARQFEAGTMDRCCQRHMRQRSKQLLEILAVGTRQRKCGRKRRIADAHNPSV